MNLLKSIIKKVAKVILIALIALSLLPYCIPLSSAPLLTSQPSPPYPNSSFFVVDQSYLHYRTYEPTVSSQNAQNTKNMLLIHGFGGSSYSFEAAIPALTEAGFHVVTVDLPGFGYSSRSTSEDHSQIHRAKLLWQLLNSLDSTVSWHLVGHSMGAGAAAAMAIQSPKQVASLTFVDGALFDPPSRNSMLIKFPPLARWIQIGLEYVLISEKNIAKTLQSAYGIAPTKDQIAGYYNPLALKGTAKSALSLLKTSRGLSQEALNTINVPTLAIWGANDTWVPISETLKLRTLMPQIELVAIEGAAHCPMETHTAIFVNILIQHSQISK